MAFKLLYTNLAGPQGDFLVNAGLVAEAGMVGVVGDNGSGDPEVTLASSGTTGLLGIIDENKTTQFYAAVANEVVVSGQQALSHANILKQSFSGNGVALTSDANATNGNLDTAYDGALGTTTTVSYSYVIPGKAGDDTTLASGKCTLWLQEGEYATDVFEISAKKGPNDYTVGTLLYVADNTYGQQGRLTARAIGAQAVGYVTKKPTAGNPYLHFFKKGL